MRWRYHLTIPRTEDCHSVRHYLSRYLLIPRYHIYCLRKRRRILINGRYLPMNFSVHAGDHVDLEFRPRDFREPFQNVTPDSAANVRVAYEDRDLLVVNKQRGDKTHPNQPGEVGTTLNHVAAYLQPKHEQPYIVHRLDQQTSGALIIAKNPAVVPILVKLIGKKRIQRSYLAWIRGIGLPKSGTINRPIGRDPHDQRKRMVNGPHAKPAITRYRVLETHPGASLLEIHLVTGRTHQIRVHFASLGHPVIGDPLYDPNSQPFSSMRLHSWRLRLIRPFYMQTLQITVPVPDNFNDILVK